MPLRHSQMKMWKGEFCRICISFRHVLADSVFLSRYHRRFLLVPHLWRKGFTGQNHKPPELRHPHQQLLCACWNSLTYKCKCFPAIWMLTFLFFFPPPPLITRTTQTQTYCLFPGSPLWTWEPFWWKQSKGKQLKALWESCRFVHEGCSFLTFYTLCFVCFSSFTIVLKLEMLRSLGSQLLLANIQWLISKTNQTPQNKAVYLFRVLFSCSPLTVVLKVWWGGVSYN